jgi:acyl-CoA synthetase (AMP-forming)/AMP-acid ligase II
MQPLYHGAGSYVAPVWIRGATHVIVSDFDPEIILEAIEKEKVTVLKTIPTLLIRLIGHPDIKKRDLSSLRTIVYGASPMPTGKLKEAISIFGPILIQTYGQSEAPNTITLLKKEDHIIKGTPQEVARLSSAGRPYSEVEVRIVDEKGNDVPPGVEGEVIVRGDVTMGGYWMDPIKTAETFRDGWIYTGDIGRWDELGYLYLVDRKGEMIISGGLNIYPSEVEQVLNEHKAVLEAAVFGVPDESWGESVKAVVVLKPGFKASEQELIEFCRNSLPGYKKPKSVEFRDTLPKSGAGKILRKALKDEYWKGYDRRIH